MGIELEPHHNGKLLVVRVTGRLEKQDYELFTPEVERLIQQQGKIRVLLETHNFHGWNAGALWEDIKFDAKHFNDIERLGSSVRRSGKKAWPNSASLSRRRKFASLSMISGSDAIVIGLVLVVNGTIGFLQEYRAETALQSLMEMVSPKAKVRRVHVFNCRSEDLSIFKKSLFSNKVLLLGLVTTGLHIAALYIPWTQKLLSLEPLSWTTWAAIVPIALSAIIVNELHKWLRPRPLLRSEG